MHKKLVLIFKLWILVSVVSMAQSDSMSIQNLDQITISAYHYPSQIIQQLPEVNGNFLLSGKKSELIDVAGSNTNIAVKTGRQVFAKVPGAFIYDMDGSGNQMNFATRGLDPHRSWEYNVRQNGVMTNSDIYGYPASHYSAPFESIEKIEVIRGTSSLQYGAQFGGMINYVTKSIDTTKTLSLENISSFGSYGLFSNYTAIHGKKNKLAYYLYYYKRDTKGYRENSNSNSEAQFASLQYDASSKFKIIAEFGRSQYKFQIPGPLTDAMFNSNPRQSTRSRNYFSPDIYLPSLRFNYKLSNKANISWVNSAVLGTRSSVQFIGFANDRDTINFTTNQYKNRQVDIDEFNSYSSEVKYFQKYAAFGSEHNLVTGVRYVNNNLHRRQLGQGTTGTNYDLSVSAQGFGRDVNFKTNNIAFFAENEFKLSSAFSITPGLRLENGESEMTGFIVYKPNQDITKTIKHSFLLAGITTQYKINENTKLYGGWAQAYRPVIFADIIPGSAIEESDQNMKDAQGSNAELGIKGRINRNLTFDFTFFDLIYKDRIGTLILLNDAGQSYVFKTNIGDSRTQGLEALINCMISTGNTYSISAFTSTSYMRGKYTRGNLRVGNENVDIKDNVLETTPNWISRNGLNIGYKNFNSTLLYSYVSESYSDALNTETPTANGGAGLVPSYSVLDFNCTLALNRQINLKFNLNNITDAQYFTKRPSGYPGVGIWGSDGRNVVITVGVKL